MKLLSIITGGRPMTRGKYVCFDRVAGDPVFEWTDTLGRRWMATGAWSLYRVRIRDGKV